VFCCMDEAPIDQNIPSLEFSVILRLHVAEPGLLHCPKNGPW
jgi:hypothetical protein